MLQEHDTCNPLCCFLTRVFKDAGVDLSRETDFEALIVYDTYDDQLMGRMKFEKAPDSSWVRRAENLHRLGDRDKCIPKLRRRSRYKRWRVE